MNRIMGLDVGDKTIGVAISDPFHLFAQGITTIWRDNLEQDINIIKDLIKKYEVDRVVVGFPKNMNNTIGPQGEKVLTFCENLGKQIPQKIILEDERLTTVYAEKMLIGQDVRRKNRKNVVDKVAATFILQSYLDRNED